MSEIIVDLGKAELMPVEPKIVKGEDGKSATITIGKVTQGDTLSVTNSGTQTDAVLDFVLPGVEVLSSTQYDQYSIHPLRSTYARIGNFLFRGVVEFKKKSLAWPQSHITHQATPERYQSVEIMPIKHILTEEERDEGWRWGPDSSGFVVDADRAWVNARNDGLYASIPSGVSRVQITHPLIDGTLTVEIIEE